MFEDITNEKKDVLKEKLGLNLTTKLDTNAIAQKIIEKNQYCTGIKLIFKIKKLKNGTMNIIMNYKGKNSEYVINEDDTLNINHRFDVNLY